MDLTSLSDKELLDLKKKVSYDISKFNNLQLARKIQANSLFGAAGNEYFRFYDVRLAEAITLTGQLTIRWLIRDINIFFNKLCGTVDEEFVIAGDTDSAYISFEKLVNKFFTDEQQKDVHKIINFLDKTCVDVIEPQIKKSCESLCKYLNTKDRTIHMKRELLADRGIWTAKKHYILNVYDEEGVRKQEPKLKIMGIEAIRSSTPKVCREKIKSCLKLIMMTDEQTVINFIAEFKKEFKGLTVEEVAFPRSLNGLSKYNDNKQIYIKGTPIQVKAALLYNHNLKKKKLTKKYELLKEGEKIKFVYLRQPNLIGDGVIGFVNALPKEFDIEKNVDYDLQFEKTFVDPIKSVLDIIGWKIERQRTLFD